MKDPTDFVLVSDVQQALDPKVFANGPWIHLATVRKGLQREYVCFRHARSGKVYIEKINQTTQDFEFISDDIEFQEIRDFMVEKGILDVAGEIKVPKNFPGLLKHGKMI